MKPKHKYKSQPESNDDDDDEYVCKQCNLQIATVIYFFVVGENRKSQPSSGESRTLIILLITNDHPNDDHDDFEN